MLPKPDYTNYTLEELYQARAGVDRNRFPETAEEVDERILQKEKEQRIARLATLYKTARSVYEEEEDLQKAHQLFQEIIDVYPDTDEARYASGYIEEILERHQKDNGDALKQQQSLKLQFNGNSREYFRIWIVNLCLTLLTLGIFSAWAKIRKKRYFYSNLTLDETPFQYLAQPIPILKGRVIAAVLFLLYYLSNNIFTSWSPYVIGAGFVIAPWVIVQSVAFNARYSAYRNMTFRFEGTYKKALIIISFGGLIPILVLGTMFNWWENFWIAAIVFGLFGILFPWWLRNIKNFIVTKTSFGGHFGQFGATGGEFFGIYFLSGLIMGGIALIAGLLTFLVHAITENIAYAAYFTMIPVYAGYILAFAYIQANMTNTVWNQARLGPISFRSTLNTVDLAIIYLTNAIGIIFSAGLLIPWAEIRTIQYRADHTQIMNDDELTEFQGNKNETVQAAGAELSEFFDLDLSI